MHIFKVELCTLLSITDSNPQSLQSNQCSQGSFTVHLVGTYKHVPTQNWPKNFLAHFSFLIVFSMRYKQRKVNMPIFFPVRLLELTFHGFSYDRLNSWLFKGKIVFLCINVIEQQHKSAICKKRERKTQQTFPCYVCHCRSVLFYHYGSHKEI